MANMSYAEFELSFVPELNDVRAAIVELLEVSSGQGHSGGSMSIFGPSFSEWAKNPSPPLSEDCLTKPFWEALQKYDVKDHSRIAVAVGKLMRHIPLTPIEDVPEQWMDVTEYCGGEKRVQQHRRMGAVFKDGDGPAHWLDAESHLSPYTDFTGFGGSHERKFITFPFDPDTPTKQFFYEDNDRTKLIEGDPWEWLAEKRELHFSGKDVDGRMKPYWWIVATREEAQEILDNYKLFKEKYSHLSKEAIKDIVIDSTYSERFPHELIRTDIRCSSFRTLKNLCRLIYCNLDGHFDEFCILPVKKPSLYYQEWEDFGFMVSAKVTFNDIFYWDSGWYAAPNKRMAQKYLFNKCKEKGLEFKGRRN